MLGACLVCPPRDSQIAKRSIRPRPGCTVSGDRVEQRSDLPELIVEPTESVVIQLFYADINVPQGLFSESNHWERFSNVTNVTLRPLA